jgi:hypothetical protein
MNVKPDPKHHAMETQHTNAKGGQRMFGGWTEAGGAQIRSTKKQIQKRRKEDKELIVWVEQQCVEQLKVKHGKVGRPQKKTRTAAAGIDESDSEDSFFRGCVDLDDDQE